MRAALITAVLWTLWCMVHSLLITSAVRGFVQKHRRLAAWYRFSYNIFSLLSLICLLWYLASFEQQPLFSFSGWWRIVQAILVAYALLLFWLGAGAYDLGYFSGIKQLRNNRQSATDPVQPRLNTGGILQYLRHPWYSAGIAFVWGAGDVTDISLAAKLVLTAYLLIGTRIEERKLRAQFGSAYEKYRRKVPALIPRLPVSGESRRAG